MTRDPHRIQPMLERLSAIWSANPDMRLGQIIVNAAHELAPSMNLYYVEDAIMLDGIELLAKRMTV